MTQYFFDLNAGASSIRYDYSGYWLANSEDAQKLAELIAMDLGCTQEGECQGFEVEVRDVTGKQLFSVLVPSAEFLAGEPVVDGRAAKIATG